jgi:hypothetical protein
MELLLLKTEIKTENPRFNKALAWAKISLDALIMNQVAKGIFAGLPWFNNYWGRDTFISLPGATLVTGQFAEAKAILRSFAAFQQMDENSTDYGCIPNTVTTADTGYNTADGTPRLVMMAKEYVERSGDSSFISEIYPVIKRSIEGTIEYHSDSLGFLTHGDAETWMDAVGPDGPWSPRGNRANDIQALWIGQLEAGIWFATRLQDMNSAEKWQEFLSVCRSSFRRMFISEDNKYIYDHLNEDGTPDTQMRPNQIFTSSLLDDTARAQVARTFAENLTYHHGIASLSQDDDNFHPFHQFAPYYPKDAAYHNGIVWTWLQGPLISELCLLGRQNIAAKITENTVYQILDRGAVGTQSELLDAVARLGEKEPRLSGTFSQAWNLAEFIRNYYDDYLGVRVNFLEHTLVLRPRLPSSLKQVRSVVNLGGRPLPIHIDMSNELKTVSIDARSLRVGFSSTIELPLQGGKLARTTFRLPPRAVLDIQLKDTVVILLVDSNKQQLSNVKHSIQDSGLSEDSLTLAAPSIRPGLKTLQGPSYPLLAHNRVKATNSRAVRLIDANDPIGDDKGMGAHGSSEDGYTYPENPHFPSGCFDMTRFTVSFDKTTAYFSLQFEALSNPGWHPEYGFQLTYVAIAIDEDGVPGSGKRLVPQNANFVLEGEHAYEKLILIGGGLQLEDNQGKILAAYVPAEDDITNPLGNANTGRISFAIPLSYLGKPTLAWTFTVLSGGQDDHGGAGLGEFRTIGKEASEWHGGGRYQVDQPNIHDLLVVPKR